MVDIFGGWGRIRTWIEKRIRIKDTGNLFVGEDTGKVTTGNYNNFVGYRAGFANTTGSSNNFIGYQAGLVNVGGHSNNFMGYRAGYNNTGGYGNNFIGQQAGLVNSSGYYNNFIGYQAAYANTSGYYNNFIGYRTGFRNTAGHSNNFIGHGSGFANTTGYNNNFIGFEAGNSNIIGYHNIFLGYKAGYYETTNLKFILDALLRADEADSRIKALIYGIFDAATANQLLRINAILQLTEIKNGATQAGAGAAANEVWKTNGHASLPDNVLMIGV